MAGSSLAWCEPRYCVLSQILSIGAIDVPDAAEPIVDDVEGDDDRQPPRMGEWMMVIDGNRLGEVQYGEAIRH